MDNRLFLLDAYALIYRAYYAFIKSPRINSKGLNTAAIFGFVNTLEDILKKELPSHIGVVFDPSGKTFRHEAFEAYKAQRESTPEDIRLAVPLIKEILHAYNIPVLCVDGFEADDVIGTLAVKGEQAGLKVFMMTPDKDYAQLVTENILMYKPARSGGKAEILGIPEVLARFEIENTLQVIDILGLMGDTSDNIPGCPGVGEKTAIKLIQEFGSIENLLAHTDQLKGKLKERVEENKEQILFSKMLATIVRDVPIELNLDLLTLSDPDVHKLQQLFEELEFRNLLQRFTKPTPATPLNEPPVKSKKSQAAGNSNMYSLFDFNEEDGIPKSTPEQIHSTPAASPVFQDAPYTEPSSSRKNIDTTPHNYYYVETKLQRASLCAALAVSPSFCFDTETTSLSPLQCELVGMSFSIKLNEAYYVPVPQNQEEAFQLVQEFKCIFEDPKIEKIGQNIKYDTLVLSNYGIKIQGKLFDTMIAHYLLRPEMRHNLNVLSETYLNYSPIPIENLIGASGKNQGNMRDVPPERVVDYACEDADVCFQLKKILEQQLKDENLTSLFEDVEMPLVETLIQIEKYGVAIDTHALDDYAIELNKTIATLNASIKEQAGIDFNVDSPKQVGEILFDRLKLDPKAKKTKSGQYSTAEEVLQKIKGKHTIIEDILTYRGLQKLLSTYVVSLPSLLNPKTNRIHTSYNQAVVATGRLSSTNPNLQNIPIRTDAGKEIRRCFIAQEGFTFLSADYSQVELRIMAHLSKDPQMLEAFNADQDIHTATAAKIYHIPLSEVTSDMRRKAKTANFGIIYGISAFGLSERLTIPRSEAKELIDGYFTTYPQVKQYMDQSIALAQEYGYVETLLRRKRFLPDINSGNSIVRGMAERNAINAPIQGSAADIIKLAMIRIQKEFEKQQLKSRMILQVHDELNFEIWNEELEQARKIICHEMEHAYKLSIPLRVDIGIGKNWLEAH